MTWGTKRSKKGGVRRGACGGKKKTTGSSTRKKVEEKRLKRFKKVEGALGGKNTIIIQIVGGDSFGKENDQNGGELTNVDWWTGTCGWAGGGKGRVRKGAGNGRQKSGRGFQSD